jgi:predicted hydrocarbon binding protein
MKSGHSVLKPQSLESLAEKFQLPVEQIVFGKLDFRELSRKLESKNSCLPERYSKAAFGRRRSHITSIDFLEEQAGWRLRTDVLQKFEIPESQLLNPFDPISVLFITDLCAYLHRRGFRYEHLLAMGAYGYKNNSKTLIGKHFASLKNPGEVYESFFTEGMKFYEQNCTYTLTKLTPTGGVFEVHSNPDVAHELGVRYVGSELLCAFKAGLAASMPLYLGLPMAQMRETACVHRGDRCCEFEFTYQHVTA